MRFLKLSIFSVVFVFLSQFSPLLANPFGVQTIQETPLFSPTFHSVVQKLAFLQQDFYRLVTEQLGAIGENPIAFLSFLGIAFIYGFLHAAGPGHGKVIISTYALANKESIKRTLSLSFLTAFLQGLTALLIISILVAAFGLLSSQIAFIVQYIELLSFFLIACLGFYLLWTRCLKSFFQSHNQTCSHHKDDKACHKHHHDEAKGCHDEHEHEHHDNKHSHDHHCHSGCSHVPFEASIVKENDRLSFARFKKDCLLCLSVAIRPCSGALLILILALSQKLYFEGVLAVMAMSFGTAIMVSLLACFAVSLQHLLGKGNNAFFNILAQNLQCFASFALFLIGLSLTYAAFIRL